MADNDTIELPPVIEFGDLRPGSYLRIDALMRFYDMVGTLWWTKRAGMSAVEFLKRHGEGFVLVFYAFRAIDNPVRQECPVRAEYSWRVGRTIGPGGRRGKIGSNAFYTFKAQKEGTEGEYVPVGELHTQAVYVNGEGRPAPRIHPRHPSKEDPRDDFTPRWKDWRRMKEGPKAVGDGTPENPSLREGRTHVIFQDLIDTFGHVNYKNYWPLGRQFVADTLFDRFGISPESYLFREVRACFRKDFRLGERYELAGNLWVEPDSEGSRATFQVYFMKPDRELREGGRVPIGTVLEVELEGSIGGAPFAAM